MYICIYIFRRLFWESGIAKVKKTCWLLMYCSAETHHHHLLGSQRLSSVPGLWTSIVCGACGAQGGQPPALVPAGHRQRPARGKGRRQTEHALAAVLLCHQRFHTHHQGALIFDYPLCCNSQMPLVTDCDDAELLRLAFFWVCCCSTALSSLCSSPQSLTLTTSVTLSAIPQLGMRGCTAPWSEPRTAPRRADPVTLFT